jgi:type II secretory pathway component HofQ
MRWCTESEYKGKQMEKKSKMLTRWIVCGSVLAGIVAGPLTTQAAPLRRGAPRIGISSHHMVKRGPGKAPITLTVNQAPIRTVLRLLFRRGNQDYVFGPRVEGVVTASLHHVPFDTALDQILAANSVRLTKTMNSGVYIIKGTQPAYAPRRQFTGRNRQGRSNRRR